MKKLMLCTDLDRTLLPNGENEESRSARERFNNYVSRDEVTLVYVSGRDWRLVEEAIVKYEIPYPDYVIGDVGSTIFKINNKEWNYLDAWEYKIQKDWKDKTNIDIQACLADIEELELQESVKQNKHKVSYYVPLHHEHRFIINKIEQRLEDLAINSNIIWSIDDIKNTGLLDILPASASKKHAIEFLMQQLDYSHQETIFAGDSGNDIDVMSSRIKSVLVANATQDVKRLAKDLAKKNKQLDNLYIAEGHFMGMNGNYSAGILEGVIHYAPDTKGWIVNENA